jgi:hypothetical protein
VEEEWEEFRALPGWVGCPNCDGPVNVRALLERHTSDVLMTALAALEDRGPVDPEVAARFEKVAQRARETASDHARTHPFKAILPP